MVPRENKNNAYAKFGGTNKEYYGIFESGLLKVHVICECLVSKETVELRRWKGSKQKFCFYQTS